MTACELSVSRLLTADQYRALLTAWRSTLSTPVRDASDYLLYALLREKDPLKAFTPCTNAVKLANGQAAWGGLTLAMNRLRVSLRHRLQQLFPGQDIELLADALLLELRALADKLPRGAR